MAHLSQVLPSSSSYCCPILLLFIIPTSTLFSCKYSLLSNKLLYQHYGLAREAFAVSLQPTYHQSAYTIINPQHGYRQAIESSVDALTGPG